MYNNFYARKGVVYCSPRRLFSPCDYQSIIAVCRIALPKLELIYLFRRRGTKKVEVPEIYTSLGQNGYWIVDGGYKSWGKKTRKVTKSPNVILDSSSTGRGWNDVAHYIRGRKEKESDTVYRNAMQSTETRCALHVRI